MVQRKVFTPETPQEFLKLNLMQQADRTTKMYLAKCTEVELFRKNKSGRSAICSEYGAIKYTLLKFNSNLVVLYQYLYSLNAEEKHLMDLRTACAEAVRYNERLRLESDREKAKGLQVAEYTDYSIILKEMGIEI